MKNIDNKKLYFKFILIVILFLQSNVIFAITNTEAAAESYFSKIKHHPKKLEDFLRKMPKGGDLHNHIAGASLAENMIRYGKGEQLCIDPKKYSVTKNTHCSRENRLDNIHLYPAKDKALIDTWSMRHFHSGKETGHDHFFSTFKKFQWIFENHNKNILIEIVKNAANENVLYLELMLTPPIKTLAFLQKKIIWNPDLSFLRKKLLNSDLKAIVKQNSHALNQDEFFLNQQLGCFSSHSHPGCSVKIRYLYQILRELPPQYVFFQLLTGFELARQDSRVVGINMVQAEDGFFSIRDYKLHMQMVGFLHSLYPDVHISLHAGELSPHLVSPENLRFHIREAIETAHAERIGHGVDIAYEDNFEQLLELMAHQHRLVEINLTSNTQILNTKPKEHPVLLYLQKGVPIALSTDDAGILRTSLTHEYQTAVQNYNFSYLTLKKFSRNSLSYSFLPGQNLWKNFDDQKPNAACVTDILGSSLISSSCQNFLNMNEKARLQWELEKKFLEFEHHYCA